MCACGIEDLGRLAPRRGRLALASISHEAAISQLRRGSGSGGAGRLLREWIGQRAGGRRIREGGGKHRHIGMQSTAACPPKLFTDEQPAPTAAPTPSQPHPASATAATAWAAVCIFDALAASCCCRLGSIVSCRLFSHQPLLDALLLPHLPWCGVIMCKRTSQLSIPLPSPATPTAYPWPPPATPGHPHHIHPPTPGHPHRIQPPTPGQPRPTPPHTTTHPAHCIAPHTPATLTHPRCCHRRPTRVQPPPSSAPTCHASAEHSSDSVLPEPASSRAENISAGPHSTCGSGSGMDTAHHPSRRSRHLRTAAGTHLWAPPAARCARPPALRSPCS